MRRRGLMGALVALVLLPGVTAADCKDGAARPQATRDPNAVPTPADAPKDWPVGGKTFYGMAITVWTEAVCLPYYVTVDATDTTTGEYINVISTDKELGLKVDHQYWTVPIAYPAGHAIVVTVHVKAGKPSQRGFITMREGGRKYSRSAEFNGTAASALEYHSQRA